MEILCQGNKDTPSFVFICQECGCIFRSTREECYPVNNYGKICYSYYEKSCPVCLAKCRSDIHILRKLYEKH